MTRPLVSVVVPTIGRATLPRTLASIRAQAGPDDVEIIVVADTHAVATPLVGDCGPVADVAAEHAARYVEHDGGVRAWGHPQRNAGQAAAGGRYVCFGQDDNAYTADAFRAIADHIAMADRARQCRPILFRVLTWQAGEVWTQPGRLARGQIDADCIVAPNDPARLGVWRPCYEGDFDFIRETCGYYGGAAAVTWASAIIAIGRPSTGAGHAR